MTFIDAIEHDAREAGRVSGTASRVLRDGRTIECRLVSAMTRRAYGYSDDVGRATWYLDGKRTSRAEIENVVVNG